MACHTRYLNDKVFEDILGALDITSVIASIHELCVCYSEFDGATSFCPGHTSTEKSMYISSVVHHCHTFSGEQSTACLAEAIEVQREVKFEHYLSKPLSLFLFRKMYFWKTIHKEVNKYTQLKQKAIQMGKLSGHSPKRSKKMEIFIFNHQHRLLS